MLAVGEDARTSIEREIREESGHTAKRLEPIGLMAVSPGVFVETVQVFLAEVDAGGAGSVHGLSEEHENIRVHILSFADALKLADEGWIEDGKTLFALNWFARKHDSIRHRWMTER
jgi:ADP-ribose pyrophosphatase